MLETKIFEAILILHTLSCFFMTGVIWVVQLVHYPSFHYVSQEKFLQFNNFHQSSISFVVMPTMIVELLTGVLLLGFMDSRLFSMGLLSTLLLIWLSTFALSVPLHNALITDGYNGEKIRALINTNWPRTILWTFRSMVLTYMLSIL